MLPFFDFEPLPLYNHVHIPVLHQNSSLRLSDEFQNCVWQNSVIASLGLILVKKVFYHIFIVSVCLYLLSF